MRDSENILIVAAHPDDEVLGCGGTIAKYRSHNANIRVVFLAEGVTSRYDDFELDSTKVKDAILYRNNNAIKALDILGVKSDNIFIGDRLCCRLDQVMLLDLIKEIEYHIHDFKPNVIFTHWKYDVNIDHSLVYRALLSAIRPLGLDFLREVFSFEVLSSTEWNTEHPFKPNMFYDISNFIDIKVKALAAYDKEMVSSPHPRSEEVLRALARYRGAQAGLNFCEGFNLIRGIK